MLFLSSLKDELVPPAHMAKLYDTSHTSGIKIWKEFENGTHNDTCMQVRSVRNEDGIDLTSLHMILAWIL